MCIPYFSPDLELPNCNILTHFRCYYIGCSYPTFNMALRDLDDCLTLQRIISKMPCDTDILKSDLNRLCRRLTGQCVFRKSVHHDGHLCMSARVWKVCLHHLLLLS